MFSLFKKLNKKDYLLILFSVILIVLQVFLDLKIPDYMAEITRLVETEGSLLKDVLINGGYMLLCALGSLVFAVIVGYISSLIASDFSRNIRKELYEKVINFSTGEIRKFKTGSLITRATNDVTNVEMYIAMGMQLMIKSPIMAFCAVGKILNKGWQWSLLTFIAVVLIMLTISLLMMIVLPKFKIVQKLIDNITEQTRENINGIRVVRAFNAEKYQEDKFDKTNTKLANLQTFNQRTMSIMMPFVSMIMYGLTLSIYFVGALLIDKAMMSEKLTLFGNMIVFSSYAMQVIMSFVMLVMIFVMYPRASISAKRINEVLSEKETIHNGSLIKNPNKEKGTIEFKNVSFKYPDAMEPMLKDISFKVTEGETLAIVGLTGCGKTTLIQLIPRLFDATEGEVLINGVNVKEYDLDYLHNLIGYVPQKAVMFNGTVKDNVAYGESSKRKTNEKIKEAIEVAQADDFVSKMDKGVDSHIAQGGTNISGGQKQRLAIARAIAKDPEIYIFDDSFSALDFKTDFTLRKELKKYTGNATNIIVAQRIGTVMHADKIIVLDKGVQVGTGTHEELLKTCKEYKEIALSQITEEELSNEK